MLLRDLRRLPQQRFCYQYQTEFSLWHKGERPQWKSSSLVILGNVRLECKVQTVIARPDTGLFNNKL